MEWYVIFFSIIGVMLAVMLIGLPIAVSLGLVSLSFMIAVAGFSRGLALVGGEIVDFWSNYTLIAVPLFIFMGEFLFAGGTAADIFDVASKWLQRLPGGLAIVAIGAGAIFATLSGSSLAGVSTIGIMSIPEMLKRGYNKRLTMGAVGGGGALAHLIPPSILAIIYSSITEVSAGRQLMAGFLPGLVLAGAFATIAVVWAIRDPASAPPEPSVSWKERIFVMRRAIWPLVMVLLVLGTIYTGLATVTEAAGLGALGALVIALVRRKLTWHIFWHTVLATIKTTAFIMFIAVAGKILSWVLTYYLIPQHLVETITGTGLNRWLILILIQLMYVVLGMFIDPVGMIIVTVPILHPVVVGLGFDVIWFGVLLLINIEMALITPPVGFTLYILQGIAPKEVKFSDILAGCFIFAMADVVVMAIVMVFPQIALWLPSKMMG